MSRRAPFAPAAQKNEGASLIPMHLQRCNVSIDDQQRAMIEARLATNPSIAYQEERTLPCPRSHPDPDEGGHRLTPIRVKRLIRAADGGHAGTSPSVCVRLPSNEPKHAAPGVPLVRFPAPPATGIRILIACHEGAHAQVEPVDCASSSAFVHIRFGLRPALGIRCSSSSH